MSTKAQLLEAIQSLQSCFEWDDEFCREMNLELKSVHDSIQLTESNEEIQKILEDAGMEEIAKKFLPLRSL